MDQRSVWLTILRTTLSYTPPIFKLCRCNHGSLYLILQSRQILPSWIVTALLMPMVQYSCLLSSQSVRFSSSLYYRIVCPYLPSVRLPQSGACGQPHRLARIMAVLRTDRVHTTHKGSWYNSYIHERWSLCRHFPSRGTYIVVAHNPQSLRPSFIFPNGIRKP